MTVCFLASCSGNGNNFGEKVKQVSIHRVDSMPDMPETYKMLDWKQKAQKYEMRDRKAFTIFSKKCTHAQEHVFKRMILGNDFRRGRDIRIYMLYYLKA